MTPQGNLDRRAFFPLWERLERAYQHNPAMWRVMNLVREDDFFELRGRIARHLLHRNRG